VKLLLIAALWASTCQAGPGPTNIPDPTPDPAGTDWPTPDSGSSTPVLGTDCGAAYDHLLELYCPPAETIHRGWVDLECARLDPSVPACIARAKSCLAARRCTGEAK